LRHTYASHATIFRDAYSNGREVVGPYANTNYYALHLANDPVLKAAEENAASCNPLWALDRSQ
jgi:hypothetical protein